MTVKEMDNVVHESKLALGRTFVLTQKTVKPEFCIMSVYGDS